MKTKVAFGMISEKWFKLDAEKNIASILFFSYFQYMLEGNIEGER